MAPKTQPTYSCIVNYSSETYKVYISQLCRNKKPSHQNGVLVEHHLVILHLISTNGIQSQQQIHVLVVKVISSQ